MQSVRDLSYHDLERIVTSIQKFLYVDQDEQGREIWEPDKQWSGADVCEHAAHLLSQHDLVPERRELLPGEKHRYTLDFIDGPTFRDQREFLLRFSRLATEGEPYETSRAEQELLDGLVNLTDAIADQAHDRHGIDCLLETDKLCDCQQPGHFYSGIPGILAHVENAQLDKASEVERCDQCERYPSDQAARDKLVELGIA